MAKLKSKVGGILTASHLAKIVRMGVVIRIMDSDDKEQKGLTVQIPNETHENIQAISKAIPGLTKSRLVSFLLDAGVYEFCLEYLVESEDPPEEDMTPTEIVTEALAQLKQLTNGEE